MDAGLVAFAGWLVMCAALVAYRLTQRIQARRQARLDDFLTVLAGDGRRRLDTAPGASEG